jgi:bifunctional oligoribonuclease and PAP phosphatase NrnA
MTDTLDALLPVFQRHKEFVLTTHVNPDGDGLGSELALAGWLLAQGKQVRIVNHSSTPDVYLFLDPDRQIERYSPDHHDALLRNTGVIVVLDTNHPDRLRSMHDAVVASPAVKVCIDHHLDPAAFADHYLLDDDATSTGEIVYRLLVRLHGPSLPRFTATALYCAIMTDTGSFRYPRVDPDIHRIVAHLLECGADPVAIYHEVYEQWSPGRFQLLGAMLEGLRTACNGRLVYVTVTQAMLRSTGTSEEDTDTFTVYPMSIRGADAAILFLELNDGLKISFRSRGDIPINALAKEFGGNGHKNAAGARLHEMTLQETVERVVAAAGRYLTASPTHG